MLLLDLTLPTPAENVALDEALLDAAEAGEMEESILRLWESTKHFVVLGRSSQAAIEANLAACRSRDIPVIRRSSGGAAIIAGPGCLMYALVMPYAGREHLRLLDELHREVIGQLQAALLPLVPAIEHVGTCDLAIADRKFSGNAVRCKRNHFLYHGTLLYAFDLALIAKLLQQPPRQPAYRADRTHIDFLTNVAIDRSTLQVALATQFDARQPLLSWPEHRVLQLVANRYSLDHWNFSR